jgi:hypothetical protein
MANGRRAARWLWYARDLVEDIPDWKHAERSAVGAAGLRSKYTVWSRLALTGSPRRSVGTQELQRRAEIHAQQARPAPEIKQRLLFETHIHWGRGLAIMIGMAATIIAFLVILTLLPRPGNGNPLESLISANNSTVSSSISPTPAANGTPAAAAGGARPTAASATPTPTWLAVAASGAPNVRSAPNTNNNPIGNLSPGRQVEITGRSPDNAWLQIVWDNNQKAWVAQQLMTIVRGDPQQIPTVH